MLYQSYHSETSSSWLRIYFLVTSYKRRICVVRIMQRSANEGLASQRAMQASSLYLQGVNAR